MRQGFQKEERLKSKLTFQKLISEGNSVKVFPFVLVWTKCDDLQEFPIKVAFSVSKKRFSLAVDRNEIKRKIREVYRLNKSKWYDKLNGKYAVLIVYTSKEKMDIKSIEKRLIKAFEQFVEATT